MKQSHHTTPILLVVAFMVCVNISVAAPQLGPPTYRMSTSCLIEIRGGKESCWGVVLNFEDGRFKKTIRRQQLRVFEAKHGANIINLMQWRTSRDGKQLTIKFKSGNGDFGTGNQAEITLYKTAFALAPKHFPEYMVIVQRTDIN